MSSLPEVRERVRRLVTDRYGECREESDGALSLSVGGTPVTVTIQPDRDQVSVVISSSARSMLASSEALFRYVATQSYQFGSLRVVEEPAGGYTAVFLHSLLGTTLDPDELAHALEQVASTTREVIGDLERLVGRDPLLRDATPPTARGPVLGPHPAPLPPAGAVWFRGSITVVQPPGWFAKESFTVLAPDGQANVIASSEPLDHAIDVARYEEVQRTLLEREFPEYHELGSGDTVLSGGISAKWRQFQWRPPDGSPVTQMQIYAVPVPGRGYTATATAKSATWDRHVELLRFIVFQAALLPGPQGTG